jgi:hypothetical protein
MVIGNPIAKQSSASWASMMRGNDFVKLPSQPV